MSLCRYAEINLDHIRHNFSQVKSLSPNASIMVMLKANAYGHGAVEIAQTLVDAQAFGVANIDEAIELREAGITQAIVVMTGFLTAEEYASIKAYELDCIVHDVYQLSYIEKFGLAKRSRLWLKIDTGLHRLGFTPVTFMQSFNQLKSIGIQPEQCIVMTHMACADELTSEMSVAQWQQFKTITDELPCMRSVTNSAALLNHPDMHCDWVRVGFTIYGGSALPQRSANSLGLRPAMTLRSRVIATKQVRAGESVGYGKTWIAESTTTVAVVAIGYGDGYPRRAPSGTPVLIEGCLYSIVGRVSMDLITVDIGSTNSIKPGATVTLWGEGLPVEDVAHHCGTIGYELMAQLTRRVKRVVVSA